MNNHLLTEIEIKEFKCFRDFKADGFKRVNLIGGKNNVGKTAFMEACYVNIYPYRSLNTASMALNDIIFIRYNQTFLQDLLLGKGMEYIKNKIIEKIKKFNNNIINSNLNNTVCNFIRDDLDLRDKENYTKYFLNSSKITDDKLEESYGVIIENGFEKEIDEIIKLVDPNIKSFRIINSEPKCNFVDNNKFINIHELGDGLYRFLSIIFSLYMCKEGYLFIDEIENGIHYTKLDKLWKIILTISKEQNVQVFSTTHSKECIESYARVSKKLEDEDISFIELGKDRDSILKAIVMDNKRFYRELENGNGVRGW